MYSNGNNTAKKYNKYEKKSHISLNRNAMDLGENSSMNISIMNDDSNGMDSPLKVVRKTKTVADGDFDVGIG